MFGSYPTYNIYRTLRYVEGNLQRGEDVYALQKALEVEPDGILGKKTGAAIVKAQESLKIAADGLAGGLTQRKLALQVAEATQDGPPFKLVKGQLETESTYRLGIYSAQRPDGSYDAGVAQRNTNFHEPEDAFDPRRLDRPSSSPRQGSP